MKRPRLCFFLGLAALVLFPLTAPAPLIYRPGEGWIYEPVGGGKWYRDRAKDQLDVAQDAFDHQRVSLALKAARRTVRRWPLSDYAPQAQYLVGRCYEAKGNDQRAFKEYQKLIEKYPKLPHYEEVLRRQFEIANRYLAGKWFKLGGVIPFFPSMTKTVEMYTKLVKNGPYSEVAPQAQMNIGQAREQQKKYQDAVAAYEQAADRYHDQRAVAAEAIFKAGLAYRKQAQRADYDQHAANQAIETFTRFRALFPDDERVKDVDEYINELRLEQARGSFATAKYYEQGRHWSRTDTGRSPLGALIYYNDVVSKAPGSPFSEEAKQRIDALKSSRDQAVRQTAPGK